MFYTQNDRLFADEVPLYLMMLAICIEERISSVIL